jgi:predicted DCC family thiol-disulfide oxidoreductase YuxK
MPGPDESSIWPVLYDEDCGFCKWSLDKLLAWDRHQRLQPVPIQSDRGRELLAEIPEERHLDSFHVVAPDGTVRSAGAAGAPLAQLLPGGTPLAFLLRTFPRTTERGYQLIANNRDRFARLLRIDASCQLRR